MEKYEAAMVLGALGNAMGDHNVCHACNKPGLKLTESDLSGEIDTMILKSFQWKVPFDTLMHMATAEALASEPKFGAAARTMCIGMCYSKAERLNDLLQASIECGQMTHSYPAGFLGTFCTALFTSYAIQGKPIAQWGRRMMQVMPIAELYCERKMKHFSDYRENWFSFETKWQFYLQLRGIEKDGCDDAMFPKIYDIEELNKLYRRWRSESSGNNKGLETTLIAYDALLFAGNDWKKLCYSAMFHWGESDATGAIAGSLYGILYGFDNVPTSLYQNLEFRGHLEQLGRQLYHVASADRSLCLSADHTNGNESIDVRQIARMFVNKRTTDEINNLINYIAQLEKVKNTSTKKSVCLTNVFAAPQAGTKAKTSKTEGKPRPTKFQLLQSRFTKIGLRNKLEKLELPEPKRKTVLEQSNIAADSQSIAANLPTVDKRDTNFTEMHSPTDLIVEQKCEPTDSKKEDGVLEKPIAKNNTTAPCHATPQAHSIAPKFPTVDSRHINFSKVHKITDLVVQQKCEPAVGKKEDATLKSSCTENGTAAFCPNTLQPMGKQTFRTDKPNDTYSETDSETDVHIQLDSQINKEIILNEPIVQMLTEVLYPATQFQANDQTKNRFIKSTRISNDIDENGVQNVNFAENINQKFPLQETVTNSSLNISEISPSDVTNIHENSFQVPKYDEGPGDTSKPIIDIPHIMTNAGLHCSLQSIEDYFLMKNNAEENPTQTVKENTEETTISLTASPDLLSDPCKTQTLKDIPQTSEPALTNEILTLQNNEPHEIKQNVEQNNYTLNQSNDLVIAVVQHSAVPKEQPLQIRKENVEKTVSQTKSLEPFINLCKKQTLKEIGQNSEPATSPKILMLLHNEIQEMKEEDSQNKYNLNYTGELGNTAIQHTVVLQEQPLQIQQGNTEKTADSQTRSSQSFTDSQEKQKLKRSPQKSEPAIATKIHMLPESESKEKKQDDNQLKYILTVVQEEQPLETLMEKTEATTISQTRSPESFTDSCEKQKLKEIPQKLQSVITNKILTLPDNELQEIKQGDYQHKDMFNQPKDLVNEAKQHGAVEEPPSAVDQDTKAESAASAQNNCAGNTAFITSKPWKYKAYSYADPSVVSKSNRRVLMRATDVIQFSSPQTSFDFP
uniref:uncharacterized protein isoform X2 n=1 Tax=Pristiophorus japonicus TaxID=55135 RepID=UPI00398ED1EC